MWNVKNFKKINHILILTKTTKNKLCKMKIDPTPTVREMKTRLPKLLLWKQKELRHWGSQLRGKTHSPADRNQYECLKFINELFTEIKTCSTQLFKSFHIVSRPYTLALDSNDHCNKRKWHYWIYIWYIWKAYIEIFTCIYICINIS